MDIISYALSKKIAEHAVSGVQSMSVEGQNLIINTKDSGVLTMTFPTPKDGVSVTDIDVNANNQIVFTMSDGNEFISGKIPTVKGEPGFSPTITENADNTDKIYKLDITTADSTFTTPNLKGADGQGGTGGGEANIIDSISVNGVNVAPDENKNVDIEIPSIEGLATETYVNNKIADYTKTADLADVATSGSYNDLNDKPTIPTVTDEYNAESSEAASGKAINQAMSTLKGLPKPYFVFVDDDGKENFKTLYTDILQPRGIVGGLSIVFSSYTIDANKYLTQNEINEYSNLGWDILCHSTDLNSLTIDTADAVLNYCDNRIAHYGFKKSNIFVYPNGNEGDNKIAIEEKVAKHFKYAFNINHSHNCPASIPLQNRMDIGRIIIPKASEITAEIKTYYKNLVDKTINENKLMIISTHSDKSDYIYLTELLDYILNQGYSFTSPVKALSEIDEYRFQNKLIPGDNISITPDNIISASFTESDPTVPSHVKSITAKNISDWNNKSDFSGSYNDLIDTPAIPSIEGLAKTEDIPTKVSDLENDSKYQTESDVTTTLTDYATKTYVGEQIANAEHLKREIVTVLPSDEEASDNIIYMLKVESITGDDKYQEYMKIDGTIKMVGDTSVDLTDYAKTVDIPTSLPADGGNSATVNNHTVETNVPADAVFTDTIYDDTEVKESIEELNNNLSQLEYSEVAGGKNLLDPNYFTSQIVKAGGISNVNGVSWDCDKVNWYIEDLSGISFKENTVYTIVLYGKCKNNEQSLTNLCIEYTDGTNSIIMFSSKNTNSLALRVTDSNKTISKLAFYYGSRGTDLNPKKCGIFEGAIKESDFEPYIPTIKMLAEEVNQQNDSLDNQGLLNKVTEMRQGKWNISSGVSEDGDYYVSSKESISCNGNSNIKLKCDNAEAFDIVFFNGSSFISGESKNGSELLFTTPSNATSFKFNIYNGNKLTPQNVGKIEVYVDSQIEQLKNDLSNLKISDVALGKNLYAGTDLTGTRYVSVPIKDLDIDKNKNYTFSFMITSSDTDVDTSGIFINATYAEDSVKQLERNKRVYATFLGSKIEYCSVYAGRDWATSTNDTITVSNIQIEEGTVATDYEPYIPSIVMLAKENAQQNTEAMDLKMLGWNVPKECPIQNYVDSDGVFHQKVGRVDLGNLDWSYGSDNTRFSTTEIIDYKKKDSNTNTWVANAFLKGYNTVSGNDTASDSYDKSIGFNGINDMFFVRNTSYTDATSFKNAMQGQYLYYELATENSMNVDGNEAITKVNESLGNYALKSLYSDTTINVGRLANSTVGNYSTAEGNNTTASASYTHSEGVNTSAIGQGSHAEGSNLEQNRYNEIVFEDPRRVEVYDKATGDFINITVAGSQAFGLNSHAEGCSTLAYGKNSHTEGYHTVAAANESHAEGCGCEANASFAHAEGIDTEARGDGSHAEGFTTTASGTYSHSEGFCTTASGTYSHAEGYYTKATNHASHASGKYNAAMTTGGGSSNTTGTAFVIGNGTGNSALSNAFSVQFNGTVKAKSTITASTTADYAEFFEWLDKNPNEEDRVGHFVTLDGDKIRIATAADDYILGIVSGEPFVLGNGDCDTWNGMYLHDEFRRTMYEPAPKMIEILDSEGNPTGEYEEVEGEYEGTRPILNPDYDPTQEYVSRFDRAEWSPVGMLGVLAVLHDGTAEVNGYITVNNEGIATKCTRDTRNSYRVIKKVSDKVVEVIFR